MKSFWKWFRWVLLVIVVGGLIAVSMIPSPVPVDVAAVSSGEMVVAVESEGVTRVRDLYVVAAPVAGRLKRIDLDEGDVIREGTEITRIFPAPMGPAGQAELEARIESIEASGKSAEANLQSLVSQREQAKKDLSRTRELFDQGAVARRELDQAELAVNNLNDQVEAARYAIRSTEAQVEAAKAGRVAYGEKDVSPVTISSPASGTVLRVMERSERIVAPGTPLVAVGDPKGLEIVVDVLSTDAVKIEAGARMIIEGWGGDENLEGIVRYVEPSAHTKYSALGIEEQRVNVVGLFSSYPDRLGDGYRVVARIVTWESPSVMQVEGSALFRDGEGWAVFVVDEGVARKRSVRVGHRNSFQAEVLEGLKEGEQVILHPSNQIEDGAQVEARGTESE